MNRKTRAILQCMFFKCNFKHVYIKRRNILFSYLLLLFLMVDLMLVRGTKL